MFENKIAPLVTSVVLLQRASIAGALLVTAIPSVRRHTSVWRQNDAVQFALLDV